MKYVNQKNEIKNGKDYCGASCVAMITEENPQEVADVIGVSAPDDALIVYLKDKGYEVKKISDGGSASTGWGYEPDTQDFQSIKEAINDGATVLYHFAGWDKKSTGHYALVVDYNDNCFLFYDPAGDRNRGYFGKSDEGENVAYGETMLKKAGIKRLWSIKK